MQVGGDAARIDQQEGEQQRQGDHRRHDQRGAPAAQEDHQHRHHQQSAHQQVLADRLHRVVDEIGALVDHVYLDASGQVVAVVEAVDALAHGIDHLGGVAALEHLHDALDHAVLAVVADDAGARTLAPP
jgi:hypothetical protein